MKHNDDPKSLQKYMSAITERKQVIIGESSLDSNQGEYYAFHINDIRMANKTL